MESNEELGAYLFLFEESGVIAEAREDWEPWGHFQSYGQLISAYEALNKLSVTEQFEGFGFFLFWDSVKSSLPEVAVQAFDDYPPNDRISAGAMLSSLLNAESFDTFIGELTDYFSSIDDELEEALSDSEVELQYWWDQKRSDVVSEIWDHSEPLRKQLTESFTE